MKRRRLSAKAVEKQRRAGHFHDGGGLYLQVTRARAKSWVFRYTRHGRAHELGLGSLKGVPLAKARKLAQDAHELLAEGIDPIEHRRAKLAAEAANKAKSVTFRHCAKSYVEAHSPSWRNKKHTAQWSSTLETYAYPVIGDRPVSQVTTDDVLTILSPLWVEKNETAKRLQQRIASVLDWARVRNYRTGHNPAQWRGHLDKLLAKPSRVKQVRHHPSMPHADLPAFMAELAALPGTAATALRFAVLTAARSGEVLGAKWEEIDLPGKTWLIPAERMKARKAHRVPLSDTAVALLDALPRVEGNDYVFPSRGERPLSSMAMLETMRRLGFSPGGQRGPYVVHGMRSSFRTWCSEKTSFPRELAEQALGHVVGDAVERAYQRSDLLDRRRKLMTDWSRYLERKPGKVVKMGGAA